MAKFTSPSKQHEEMAQKILARRGASKSNDKPAPKKSEAPVTPTVGKVPDTTVDVYGGKGIKDLRAMCDAHEPAIKYKKKDTIAKLIEKLEA